MNDEPDDRGGPAMKRRSFMDGVSEKALMRGEIRADEIGVHKVLSGLSKDFRESASWRGPKMPIDREGMVVQMVRLPNDEPNPMRDTSLGFVDRRKHNGPAAEISIDAVARLWTDGLSYIRPIPLDWFKAGPVIWDQLEFAIGSDWTTKMLWLKRADRAMTRAYQAALMAGFAMNNGTTTDLESLHVAVTTFIHAHPAFAKVIEEAQWHLPYAENTAVRLLGPGR